MKDEWKLIKDAPKNNPEGEAMDRYCGPWILAANNHEARVCRWTTEYPLTKGGWMYAYEPTDYIDNIKTFEPTKWQELVLPNGKEMKYD